MSSIFDKQFRLFNFYIMITTKFDKLSLVEKFLFQIWLKRRKYQNLACHNYSREDVENIMKKVEKYVDVKLDILYFSCKENT